MTLKHEIRRWIFVIVIMAAVFMVIVAIIHNSIYMKNVPEHIEHVEVVGKRINPAEDSEDYPDYYVTFKFSDGSVKEFSAGRPNNKDCYNAINEGDIGKLTYKESGNNRRFESFEKDLDFGGMKIEPYRLDEINEVINAVIICAIFVPFMVFMLRKISEKNIVNESPEQCAHVQVINKRMEECRTDYTTYHYYVSFKFSDKSEKEFGIGIDFENKGKRRISGNIYDSMNKGDTGELTYKESEEVIKKIKNQDSHYFGRSFVKFEKHIP